MQYLKLFESDYISRTPLRGVTIPRDLNYLRKLYHFNETAIGKYYRDREFAAKNSNVVSRLLEHIDPNLNNTVDRFSEIMRSRINYIGKFFRLTSEIEAGIVQPGLFFGKDNEEIVIANDEYFNPYEVEKNWKTASVLKIYKHEINDLKLLLPTGKTTGSRTGICSVSINLPKLAIMYRCFIREQRNNALMGSATLNKNYFVFKYIFSNNMKDIIDHVFLNKVMDKFYGRDEVIPKFKHPFKIYEPTTQVDRYVENVVDVITNKDLGFLDVLHNIPLMYNNSALDLLGLPDIAPTRQISWAVIISRLDHMLFLLDVAGKLNVNSHHINDWKKLTFRLLRDNTFNGLFSYEKEKDIKDKLEKIATW